MAALRLFDDVLRIVVLSKVLPLDKNYKSSKECPSIIQRATCASTKIFGPCVSPGLSTRPSSDRISQHGDQIESRDSCLLWRMSKGSREQEASSSRRPHEP
jgi:hypothetical protein